MDANELARLRTDMLALMPETCDVLSVTRAADGLGGFVETWGTASAGVACRMDHRVGSEQLTGGAVQAYQGDMLSVPYGTAIATGNRVRYAGGTYNVVSVSEGSSLAVKRAMVQRV